jgi:peptide deformylase
MFGLLLFSQEKAAGPWDRIMEAVYSRPEEDTITMAIRKIVVQGDPLLTKKCRPVTEFNQRLHVLLDDMRETLEEAQGAGLAAPQVGILRRAVIVADDDNGVMELINPEIISQEGEQAGPEGCLSVPGKWGMVTRPERVKIRAQDRFGSWFEAEGEGLTARCFCHEIEHLDGRLYVEHIDHFLTEEELEAFYAEQEEE